MLTKATASHYPAYLSGPIRFIAVLFSLLTLVLLPGAGLAQQSLADGDWFERELGAGVVWRYYLFENLHGRPQSVSYIDADLSNPNVSIEFPYLAAARQKTSTMVPSQFPAAKGAINGSYFVTTGSGGHSTYLRINNTEIPPGGPLFSPFGYEGAIALTGSGAASIVKKPGGGWNQNTVHPDILACGPVVTFNGAVPTATLNSYGSHCTNRHPRSGVGITGNNHLILFTVDGRTAMSDGMTCDELGQAMLELGCVDALNLDGGGSTTLWGAGEQYNGVLNYPTDNGNYDHLGERGCSNAISVLSTPAMAAPWDGWLTSKSYSRSMASGNTQTAQLKYKNTGTSTWTSANTKLVLSRPEGRSSLLEAAGWVSPNQPALMVPSVVAPGQTATFTFSLEAPVITTSALIQENFMLTQTGVGRIGPPDSEAWMNVSVQVPVAPFETFIVESRPGGQNFAWYADSGMADTSTDCLAPGASLDIGTRYGSTYRSVAGAKHATVTPDFPEDGFYNVYVAWPAAGNRRAPVTYHVYQPGSDFKVNLDQATTANQWIKLGSEPFFFGKGMGSAVSMTNEDIDISGNMYAGAVKFEFVPSPEPVKSYEVRYLHVGAQAPVIDGVSSPGEWDGAAPAGSGFVLHNNPGVAAAEDASFSMLYDDARLYIRFSMDNPYLPPYSVPPAEYAYTNLSGDKISFYFTPGGVNRQKFYRVTLSPNPTDGVCYVWSQASLVKTTSGVAGTDWKQRGGAAYSYQGKKLVVEYSIPWANFNYTGMEFETAPLAGDVWGAQPSISNYLSSSSSESVNWEPDATPSFVMGEPFGRLTFVKPTTAVTDWVLY